jgi:spheroidene monooxygenase
MNAPVRTTADAVPTEVPGGQPAATTTVVLSFFRYRGLYNHLWAFSQMGFARLPLSRSPEIGFWKLFGSGTGEGFTPVPNAHVSAMLTTWKTPEAAREGTVNHPVLRRYRDHAVESFHVHLATMSARGRWDGQEPFAISSTVRRPPVIAVLTRATVKPQHVIRFWSHTPDISALVRDQTHLKFKIGIGEVPWFQQVTFSIWDDMDAMTAFAYRSAQHGGAVRQVRDNRWFREELYARFQVLSAEGTWEGREPLKGLDFGA